MTKLNTEIKFCYEIEMKFKKKNHYKIDDGTRRPRSLENKSNHSAFYSKVKKKKF